MDCVNPLVASLAWCVFSKPAAQPPSPAAARCCNLRKFYSPPPHCRAGPLAAILDCNLPVRPHPGEISQQLPRPTSRPRLSRQLPVQHTSLLRSPSVITSAPQPTELVEAVSPPTHRGCPRPPPLSAARVRARRGGYEIIRSRPPYLACITVIAAAH